MAVPKVLMLVIYNPSPLYDAQRDFWRRYMNSSPHISCYFVACSQVSEVTLDGDTLYIPGTESYEGITRKTLDALEYFLWSTETYDFIIRTNISSIWDYPKLLTYLQSLPSTNVYAGKPGGVRGDMTFVSGSGIVMTPDVCQKLVDARTLALSFAIIDDVDIGYTFERLGVPITLGERFDVEDDTMVIPSGHYHYRVRLLPQPPNVIERTLACMHRIQTPSYLRTQYQIKCATASDINEHLPTLMTYASRCRTIIECGVREPTSSYALAVGLLGVSENQHTMIDPYQSASVRDFIIACAHEGVSAAFFKGSDLECPLMESDLLFIDTWHVYGHLKRELARWNGVIKKYIILHDTTVDEIYGETIRNGWDPVKQSAETGIPVDEITRGLGPAVDEFLAEHPEWALEAKYTHNNGLTILRRLH
jgi:hypothetical protein